MEYPCDSPAGAKTGSARLEHETALFVEVDAAEALGPVAIVEGNGSLEGVAVLFGVPRGGAGALDFEQRFAVWRWASFW